MTPALVMIVTFLVYLPVLDNGFVSWDDHIVLLENFNYRGFEWDRIKWMFATRLMCHFQPLTWLTYALDYKLWGMDPWGYHLTSLVFHVAAAGVFFWVARHLLHLAVGRAQKRSDVGLDIAAGLTALLFAIHPLRVESVAWATERRDVTSGLFLMLALAAYLRAAAVTGRSRRKWLTVSLATYVLSLMGKAMGMTLPAVLVVLDAYPLGRLGRFGRGWLARSVRHVWWEKAPYFAVAAAAGAVAFLGQYQSSALATIKGFPLVARIPIAFYGPAFYVYKTLVPLGLSPMYQLDPPSHPPMWHFAVTAAVIVLISVGAFLLARRWPAGLVVWITYLVILAPVVGVIQIGPQIAADRYTYLSCLGWAILAGGLWLSAWRRWADGRTWKAIIVVASATAAAACGALGWLTQRQVGIWKDTGTLWAHAIDVQPATAIAHINMADWLDSQGELDKALAHHRKGVELRPHLAGALSDMGNTLRKLDRKAEAVAAFRKALQIDPKCLGARNGLGMILTRSRDLTAVREGIQHFKRALENDPTYLPARVNLAEHYLRTRRYARAQAVLREGLRLDPRSAPLAAKLAWQLATCPKQDACNPSEALALAHQACQATGYRNPAILNVLAAALAATGRFDQAAQTARQAAQLARQAQRHQLADVTEERAQAYAAHRIWWPTR